MGNRHDAGQHKFSGIFICYIPFGIFPFSLCWRQETYNKSHISRRKWKIKAPDIDPSTGYLANLPCLLFPVLPFFQSFSFNHLSRFQKKFRGLL